MEKIKNIIFDLGGVLLDVDYHKTAHAFKLLGAKNFDEFYSQSTADHLFEALETGEIPAEIFYDSIKKHCEPGTTWLQIQLAWNAILLDFRKESLNVLEKLKDKYNLYLFSNTNCIHHEAFNQILQDQTGQASIDQYFIKAYYSHIIHQRKPYPASYLWILNDGNMQANETLFIDDSINNINGAIAVGLKTHLLLPGEKIENLGL